MRPPLRLFFPAALLVVVLAAGGYWFFLRDDAPAPVSIDTAAETVHAGGDEAAATAVELAGLWSVVPDENGTFAGFRIQEELASIGATTAVGRTPDVTGTIEIDGTTVTAAAFDVDFTTITTDESRRDGRVQDALETSQFPSGTFVLAEPIELGDGAASGETVTVTAVGDLTIHGVTRRVSLPIEARLVDDTIVVVGSLDIVFSDYGVEVPDSQIVLSVEDHGTMELQALLRKA